LKFDKIFILDTNVILEDANELIRLGELGKNLIVLPETVIDELDSKKSGFNEINFQAREFGRILSEAEVIDTKKVMLGKQTITSLSVQGIFIDIVSIESYDLEGVDSKIINDRKIIKVAEFASTHYCNPVNTTLLSNDVMCRTRAISFGVNTQGIDRNREQAKPQFIVSLQLDHSDLNKLLYANILEVNPDHQPEHYCYHFVGADGQERIGYIVDNQIRLINDKDYNKLPVKPLNLGQRFAMSGMLDSDIDVCIIEALAGSGKTLLAISAGMLAVERGDYDKIIYIRNSVESVDSAEAVGFLSGNDEKFKIYNYPLYDVLEFIVNQTAKTAPKSNKNSSPKESPKESTDSRIEEVTDRYNIETMWTGAIRGRTITNSYVIVDEVQNFAKPSLQTVLSRMDKDSKVVCIGSNRQIDHPYINKYTNGLSVLLQAAKKESNDVVLFGTELNKVVRGKITEWAERIFEK
jgi:PhoH-like ATPase